MMGKEEFNPFNNQSILVAIIIVSIFTLLCPWLMLFLIISIAIGYFLTHKLFIYHLNKGSRGLYHFYLFYSKQKQSISEQNSTETGVNLHDVNVESETTRLVTLIRRDFFDFWFYGSVSTNQQFISDADHILQTALVDLWKHLQQCDQKILILIFIRCFRIHFQEFFAGKNRQQNNRTEALTTSPPCLTSTACFPAANEKEIQFFRCLTEILFVSVFPKDNPIFQSKSLRIILAEAFSQKLFIPLLELFSQPHWLRVQLVRLLSDESGSKQLETIISSPIQEADSISLSSSLFVPEDNQSISSSSSLIDHHHQQRNPSFLNNLNDNVSVDLPQNEQLLKEVQDRTFLSIEVTGSFNQTETSGKTQYTLYKIEYCAVYLNDDPSVCNRTVHRRFREFVSLHETLTGDVIFRKKLQDIEGPSRWALPRFKTLNDEVIDSRKAFLTQYLKDLIHIQLINNSSVMKEFLAYKSDPSIAFLRRAKMDFAIPRVDRVIVRSLSDIVDKIASSLPSQTTIPNLIPRREEKDIDPVLGEVETVFEKEPSAFEHSLQAFIEQEIKSPTNDEPETMAVPSMTHLLPHVKGNGATAAVTTKDIVDEQRPEQEVPVGVELLGLAFDALKTQPHWAANEIVSKVTRLLFAAFVDRLVQDQLERVTSQPYCATYLRLLRETIWPNDQMDPMTSPPPTAEQELQVRELIAKVAYDFFPGLIPSLFGPSTVHACIRLALECIEDPTSNRRFVLAFVEQVVPVLFPAMSGSEHLVELLRFSS